MSLRIERVCAPEQLTASTRDQWNNLPVQSPTQLPDWLMTWWRVFGEESGSGKDQLCILTVFQGEALVAVAPWYLSHSRQNGNCLRFLGDGIIGSAHASIVFGNVAVDSVIRVLSHWLRCENGRRWQTIKFESIDNDNVPVQQIVHNLHKDGCDVHTRKSVGAWSLELPDSWDTFSKGLSHDRRERCDRWHRCYLANDRARVVTTPGVTYEHGWNEIVRLNQPQIATDQQSGDLGVGSVFDDRRYHEFHLTILPSLVRNGQAQLRELIVDGQVVAAEYMLRHNDAVCYYQGSARAMECRDSYRDLALLALIKDAIRDGIHRIEVLRGDDMPQCDWGGQTRGFVSYVVAAQALAGSAQAASYRAADTLRALNEMIGASLSMDGSVL